MKLESFVMYAYASIMLPILIAMLIGLLILGISTYLTDKENQRLEFEDFVYRLQCKTNSELMDLKARYTSYLTDDYLKSSNKEWNQKIDAIQQYMETRNAK